MYNSSQQKPYSSSQPTPIELEETEASIVASQKLISELSEGISKLMLPLYEEFKHYATEDGKIMGHYTILKFPITEEVKITPKKTSITTYSPLPDAVQDPYQKANFRQLANRVQEKEKQQMRQSLSESKIHQLLDQNEASQYNETGYDDRYGGEMAEKKRLQKARKYYEKLAKDMKSGKRYKKKFKDKNRPKKAKSSYNLFVEDVVPQIKSENPSFSAPDLVRVAAKMYNQLTEEEKVPYQRRYLLDKERFERERELYFKKNPEMDYRMNAKQKSYIQQGKYRQM